MVEITDTSFEEEEGRGYAYVGVFVVRGRVGLGFRVWSMGGLGFGL